jgi:hypothetical protein
LQNKKKDFIVSSADIFALILLELQIGTVFRSLHVKAHSFEELFGTHLEKHFVKLIKVLISISSSKGVV